MSTSQILCWALESRGHTGRERLAVLSLCDSQGVASIKSVCRWCNCGEDEAREIIAALVEDGTLVESNGDLVNPPSFFLANPEIMRQAARDRAAV